MGTVDTGDDNGLRRILLLANGPGELWCWARPMIKEFSERGIEVSLKLLPCQYAAGNETAIALDIGAAEITPPLSVFWNIICGESVRPDAVLQMGGDLLFGIALSRRNRIPLFSYSYGAKPLAGACSAVFTAFEHARHSILPGSDKVFVVGDLVADSLAMDCDPFSWPEGGKFRVVFFPGSRRSIRAVAMPFIRDIKYSLEKRLPGVDTVSALSPFASAEEVREWKSAGLNPATASAGSILRGADLAITQPGTNTLEMACTGTPGIVAVPFAFLRQIPISGLKGAIGSIPLIGPWIREVLLRRANTRRGFLAWPNRLAGKEIMPELVGDISHEEIARAAEELLQDRDRLEWMKVELGRISRQPGSAGRIAEKIADITG